MRKKLYGILIYNIQVIKNDLWNMFSIWSYYNWMLSNYFYKKKKIITDSSTKK